MDIPLTAGTLLSPYECWQTLYEQMFALGKGVSPDITGILIQDAAPDPIYRGNKGWIPTSGGVPIYPGYVFIWHATVGHWVSRNPVADSDASRRVWTGAAADIDTYDHGEAGVVGPAAGPMWEFDTTFDGRVPIGAGTIPNSGGATVAINATTDSLGGVGEYKHSLLANEIQHFHGVGQDAMQLSPNTEDDPAIQLHRAWDSGANSYTMSQNDMVAPGSHGYVDGALAHVGIFGTTKALADPDFPVVDGHNNMQPYVGVYLIRRTTRQFYRMG